MLRDAINNALKDAMKAGDARRVSTLRLVNSSLKNADIEARGQGKPPLSDEDALGVKQPVHPGARSGLAHDGGAAARSECVERRAMTR